MEKILLIVDLEESYLTDDDILNLIRDEYWDEVRQDMKRLFDKIVEKTKELKKKGFKIHFTGEEEPYGDLKYIVDEILPYWFENKQFIKNYYNDNQIVVLGGLFRERCVHAVNQIIKNSIVSKELTISHGVIGDCEGRYFKYNFSDIT